jgi:hypothetical protein
VWIYRANRLIDIQNPPRESYVDRLLWESTRYTYTIRQLDVLGNLTKESSFVATTPEQEGLFPVPFSPTSFWNDLIKPNHELDPDSDLMIDTLTDNVVHPNLGNSDAWGIAVSYNHSSSRSYVVLCRPPYECHDIVRYKIPQYAEPSTESDGHLVVIEPDSTDILDMWQAEHLGRYPLDEWWAAGRYVLESSGQGNSLNCPMGTRCWGGVAAGWSSLGGVVRPEEIAQGLIPHALSMALDPKAVRAGSGSGEFIACPATSSDGDPANNGRRFIPEGAHLQLDPSFDIPASWPRYERTIARALQDYGAYVADRGGSLSFAGETGAPKGVSRGYNAWALVGVGEAPSLEDIPWGRFRVLDMKKNTGDGCV